MLENGAQFGFRVFDKGGDKKKRGGQIFPAMRVRNGGNPVKAFPQARPRIRDAFLIEIGGIFLIP